MRELSTSHWDPTAQTHGLRLFVQRLEELTFKYTFASYRAPSRNASFLCQEALEIYDYIDSGQLLDHSINFVLEELGWSISKDLTAKALINFNFSGDLKKMDTKSQRSKIKMLYDLIEPKKYQMKLESEIKNAIFSNEIEKIDSLSKNYVSNLINIGYSKEYFNKTVDNFFRKNKVSSLDDIDSFFKLFQGKFKNFDIIILIDETALPMNASLNQEIVTISNNIPVEDEVLNKLIATHNERSAFAHFKNFKALDPNQAKQTCETLLEHFCSLYALFHHKYKIKIKSECYIKDTAENYAFVSEPEISASRRIRDFMPHTASNRMNEYIKNRYSQPFGKDYNRFDAASSLHRRALAEEDPQGQLLLLWTALETVTPKFDNKSIILNVSESLIPFVMLYYFDYLLLSLLRDIRYFDKGILTALSKIPMIGDPTIIERLLTVMYSPCYEPFNSWLLERVSSFELLHFRYSKIHRAVNDLDIYKTMLKEHKKKVEWQIQRIYLTRNKIVHSGKVFENIESIIENAHEYLDIVFNTCIQYAKQPYTLIDSNSIFELIKSKYIDFEEKLKSQTSPPAETEYSSFFLGSDQKFFYL